MCHRATHLIAHCGWRREKEREREREREREGKREKERERERKREGEREREREDRRGIREGWSIGKGEREDNINFTIISQHIILIHIWENFKLIKFIT